MALSFYQNASYEVPNRTINTLGLARTSEKIGNYREAARFYRLILDIMSSANVTENAIVTESNEFFRKYGSLLTTATNSVPNFHPSYLLLPMFFYLLQF